jgi:bifunctional DNA-binding transcriptional regulator/antitoxin component of YhaV-PrlF toxin-antitoxin module
MYMSLIEGKSMVSKKRLTTVPKSIAEALAIDVGTILKWRVEEGKITVEPVKDPYTFLKGALSDIKISYNEMEEKSEEILMKTVKEIGEEVKEK